MRYIIISLIILLLPYFTSAQETTDLKPNWFHRTYQNIQNLPQEIEKSTKYIWGKAQEKKKEKQEEIKQEIKKGIKKEIQEWTQKGLTNLKEKVLNPLKNKIQQGSTFIRQGIYEIKDYFIELF